MFFFLEKSKAPESRGHVCFVPRLYTKHLVPCQEHSGCPTQIYWVLLQLINVNFFLSLKTHTIQATEIESGNVQKLGKPPRDLICPQLLQEMDVLPMDSWENAQQVPVYLFLKWF